jgi:nicotinate-nucleotide adenylyltransferase
VIIAEEARERLELEEVVFIPTGQPWMKADKHVTPAHHRLNMVRLATASNPYFRVSFMEVEREGPSYTVDTLEALRCEFGEVVELYFILGVDSLREFHRWKEPEKVLSLASLVVASRSGFDGGVISSFGERFSGVAESMVVLEGVQVEISARDLRCRAASGESLRYRLCDEVARYIVEHGLYAG